MPDTYPLLPPQPDTHAAAGKAMLACTVALAVTVGAAFAAWPDTDAYDAHPNYGAVSQVAPVIPMRAPSSTLGQGPIVNGSPFAPYVPPVVVKVPAAPTTTASKRKASPATDDVIMEDDPRWDCRTMGNGLCGPGATLPDGSPAPVNTTGRVSAEDEEFTRNDRTDPHRGQAGYVQAEDGSWVPTSFYDQTSY